MPAALSTDLRWRVVWARDLDGKALPQIARDLHIGEKTVRRILKRFDVTGDVRAHQGKGGGLPTERSNTVMTYAQDMKLLELVTVLDDKSMLSEIQKHFVDATGVHASVSTICRAMRRLGYTRKKARRRRQQLAAPARLPARAALHVGSLLLRAHACSCTRSPFSATSCEPTSSTAGS